MKITEEQTGYSPLSFATDHTYSDDQTLMLVDPDENETGIEDEDDLREVRVNDDLNEPDPEGDYAEEKEIYEDESDDEPDPVPSPS